MDIYKEALRYMGYGRNEADEDILERLDECRKNLEKAVMPKSVTHITEIAIENDEIKAEGVVFKSKNLAKNLKGCKKAVLMATTLGQGADMVIRRFSKTDMPMAVISDALATAMIEEYCDSICEGLGKEGYNLRPRFSPGYGDFDISHQKDFMDILQCPKKIGLSVTDGLMLVPTKSVTAIIGISEGEEKCIAEGCEVCEKTDCPYRRD